MSYGIITVGILPIDFVLWFFVIRPYCVRNHKAYTPGANLGVTAWIDWQEATEMAKANGHQGILFVCRLFLMLNVLFFVLLVASVLSVV